MKWTGLNELREKFLSFYVSKGHTRLPSAPLVPQDMKDSVVKQELTDMTTRPKSFRNRNSIRLKTEKDGKNH